MKYYFAYGSNLNKNQMKKRCPKARAVGSFVLVGYRLVFRGRNYNAHLTIEKSKDASDFIPIGIWEITKDCEKSLDIYEGVPHYYIKKKMRIKDDFGKPYQGLIYIMNDGFNESLPNTEYLRICSDGYHDFGFEITTLHKAVKFKREG